MPNRRDPVAGRPPLREPLRGRPGELVQEIGGRIGAGELRPGDSVNPEALMAEFAVSRQVAREALKVLETKGLVVPRPRVGTRVADPSSWDVLDHDVITWQLSAKTPPPQLADLLALRASIEPMAARQLARSDGAAVHAAELADWVAAMGKAVAAGDYASFCSSDTEFHASVIAASGNPVFRRLSGTVTAVLEARNRLGLMPEDMSEDVVEQHATIVAAIRDRAPWLAERSMRALIDHAGEELDESDSSDTGDTRKESE